MSAQTSRHGKTADGWTRRGIQIPLAHDAVFEEDARRWGHGAVTLLGTACVGMFLGLREEVRHELYLRLLRRLHAGTEALAPLFIWREAFLAIDTAARDAGIESADAIAWATNIPTNAKLPTPARVEMVPISLFSAPAQQQIRELMRLMDQNGNTDDRTDKTGGEK